MSELGSLEVHSRVARRGHWLQGFEQRGSVMRRLPITTSVVLLSLWSPDFSAFERPADCASFPFCGVGQETASRLPRFRLPPAYRFRSLSISAPPTKGAFGLESNPRWEWSSVPGMLPLGPSRACLTVGFQDTRKCHHSFQLTKVCTVHNR